MVLLSVQHAAPFPTGCSSWQRLLEADWWRRQQLEHLINAEAAIAQLGMSTHQGPPQRAIATGGGWQRLTGKTWFVTVTPHSLVQGLIQGLRNHAKQLFLLLWRTTDYKMGRLWFTPHTSSHVL